MAQKVNENTVLSTTAERCGLGDEPAVCCKAEEFLRVLQTKGALKNVNDYARAVFCLDLASSLLGIGFDKETGVKLSGMKKTQYQNNRNIIEKMLELDKPLSVKEVCVQCSCTVAKDLADQILLAYKARGLGGDPDHPQYVAVSVYTACKLMNFKVSKPQFLTLSRLKAAQWKELEAEFMKFATKLGLSVNGKKGSSKVSGRSELHNYLEEYAAKSDENNSPSKVPRGEKEVEDYEVWKERILKEAREHLNREEIS